MWESPPRHDWRGIRDPVADLPTAYHPRSGLIITVPPQYKPPAAQQLALAAHPEPSVELHAPDGPGPGRVVRWQGREVRLNGVQYRVVAYLWTRQSVGFDELAAHVNENRPHQMPTDQGFKTWVSRGNKELDPLGLPRRLRADTVNRLVYWEPVPVVSTGDDGFSGETRAETASPPA